jgi:hypothetical protein
MMPGPNLRFSRKEAGWLRLALIPFRVRRLPDRADDETYVAKYSAPIWLEGNTSKHAQRTAYRALLNCRWLAPKVRNAIMAELGMSVRQGKLRSAARQAKFWRAEIDEHVRRMREKGEQPRGGARDAAIAKIATRNGMTLEAFKKRLQRHK